MTEPAVTRKLTLPAKPAPAAPKPAPSTATVKAAPPADPKPDKPDPHYIASGWVKAFRGKTVVAHAMDGKQYSGKLGGVDIYTILLENRDGEPTTLLFKHGIIALTAESP